jgi:MFS family permease
MMPSAAGFVLAGILFGCAHGLYYPALNALVLDATPQPLRARAMSIFNVAFVAGATVGVFLYGVVAESAGYRAMFLAAAAMTACAATLLGFRERVT